MKKAATKHVLPRGCVMISEKDETVKLGYNYQAPSLRLLLFRAASKFSAYSTPRAELCKSTVAQPDLSSLLSFVSLPLGSLWWYNNCPQGNIPHLVAGAGTKVVEATISGVYSPEHVCAK